jgi:hypothetical protein
MKSTKTAKSTQSNRREASNLEVRYGDIGISAVAAAMRYQGDVKSPARVPADRLPDRWLKDMVPEFAA